MSENLSWIHLTDLHFGQSNEWLWPGMRQEFYRDLEDMFSVTGPWDIVFFSGDFVNRGSQQEYDDLRKEIDRLWKHFRKLGCDPLLVCVPGNHDLQRPASTDFITRQSRRWHHPEEEIVRNEFWSDPKSQYRKAVNKAFKNYVGWLKLLQVPQPKLTKGLLPGDFSAVLKINKMCCGLVGLNSTFLQLGSEDYEGLLDLHVKQLHVVCGDDAAAWRDSVDLAILMTHQPPSWLHEHAKAQLSEIYALGKFQVHLTGHLHDPKMHDVSESGGPVRRLRQGASLFGLAKFGINETRPLFGYTMGRYNVEDNKAVETLWPRIAEQIRGENVQRLGADRGGGVDKENKLQSSFITRPAIPSILRATPITIVVQKRSGNQTSTTEGIGSDSFNSSQIAGSDVDRNNRKVLDEVPKAKIKAEDHHRAVRTELQHKASDILHSNRPLWMVADWGIGKHGFLATAVEMFAGLAIADVYIIQCGDAKTCVEIQILAETQLGLSFQDFFHYASSRHTSVLIFDDLPSTFVVGEERSKLEAVIVNPVKQFCPNLRLIFVARQKPSGVSDENLVSLKPLQAHEIRNYLKHHKDVQKGLEDSETLDRIQDWSEGLPMRLDQMLEQLQVFSLSELLNEESETLDGEHTDSEPIPRALKDAVTQLQNATTTQSSQSFRLLNVLTVLKDGEVFQSIRRFYPKSPFYLSNVSELMQFNLIEAVPIAQTSTGLSYKKSYGAELQADAPKLLRVPKQVRDYVKRIMTVEDYDKIFEDSTEVLFGRGWREGDIELRRSLETSYRASSLPGPGNEYVVAQHLLTDAFHSGEDFQIRRAITLGLNLCSKLFAMDRFRDCAIASEKLMHTLDGIGFNDEYAKAARLNGCSLRMMDYDEVAIEILQVALRYGYKCFPKDLQASTHIDIALAYAHLQQSEKAVEAANQVLAITEEKSPNAYQARAIIAEMTIDDPVQLEAELVRLLQSCRRRHYDGVANNIALDLARRGKNRKDSLERLEDVLKTAKGNYNRTRAIVQKASLLNMLGQSEKLTEQDRDLLEVAYNYSYGQRIGNLLERCHSVLWELFSGDGFWGGMLRLFRRSSFFWLLKGDNKSESQYIRELDSLNVLELQRTEGKAFDNEILYLELRRREHPKENSGDEAN